MKKTDIAGVILIGIAATAIAYFLGNLFLGDPSAEKVTVTFMDVVSADLAQPEPEVFNLGAVNPTVEVFIGNCTEGQIWDEINRTCVSTTPEPEPEPDTEDNPETDSETSETGD